MLCFVRIVIHDRLYEVLHPAMKGVHFAQKFTDGIDGKRRHALGGTYVSEHYTSARIAFLYATAAALQVDPAAQVMLIPGDQIFSHGCREEDSLASLLEEWAKLNPPSPALSAFGSLPEGFCEGFASAMSQNKGAALGSVPSSMPAPMTYEEIIGKLTQL